MDDLISRQAAIEAMGCVSDSICAQQAIDALADLPSAERRGRWEYPYGNKRVKVCSECGRHFTNNLPWQASYCPRCGARMEAGE